MQNDKFRMDAEESWRWFRSFVDVGFTEEQAMQILCRPAVQMMPAQYPPEVMEFWERQNALATKMMIEMDDE